MELREYISAISEKALNDLVLMSPIGMAILEPIISKTGEIEDYVFIYTNWVLEANPNLNIKGSTSPTLASVFNSLPPEELKGLLETFNSALRSKKNRTFRIELNGTYIVISVFGIGERIVGAILDDITHYVSKELELFNLVNELPSPAFLISRDGIVIKANKAAKALGMKEGLPCWLGIMEGRCISEEDRRLFEGGLISERDIRCIHCKSKEAFHTMLPKKEVIKVDSRYMEIWWIPLLGDKFLHYLVDVTEYYAQARELKRYSEMLIEEKAFFQDVLNSIPIGIAVVNPATHRVILVNSEMLDTSKMSREDILKSKCFDLFCKGSVNECPLSGDGESVISAKTQIKMLDGTLRTFIRNEILRKANGFNYIIVTLTDVTELTALNAQLADANALAEKLNMQLLREKERAEALAAQARAASEAKTQFLASMSHEIRTPLNAVIGFSELLMTESMSEEQRSYVNLISSSAKLLMELIDDILDFSRIEAGKLELEIEPFDLFKLLDDLITAVSLKARQKGIELIYAPDMRIPPKILGDPRRTKQVLLNLLGNAVKFTNSGYVELSSYLLSHHRDRLVVRFVVKDTGPGIPKDKVEAIFDPFEQIGRTTKKIHEGVGLGLAITKRLVDLMQGKIGVESTLGKGSLFWVEIPLRLLDEGKSTFPIIPEIQGKRCLLVGSFYGDRVVLEIILKHMGMKQETVEDPYIALVKLNEAVISSEGFELLIIDQEMPKIKGTEFIKKIRENPHFSNIKLLLVLSIGDRLDESQLEELRNCKIISKPIRIRNMEGALKELFDSSYNRLDNGLEVLPYEIRALVVEDNVVNQKVAQAMLQKLGVKVDIASGGDEAISLMKDNYYDIVFMDIEMPGLDGFDTIKLIRDPALDLKSKDVPTIAMTAHAIKDIKEACLIAGMNDYISKPVSLDDLKRVINKWVNRRGF
ncbi:MAG: response regulator [Syntrophobacterales bacterium]|nr:response regulator [Syntrophobacterales bacterium]